MPDGAFRIKALLASDGISLSHAVLNRLTDKQRVIISPTILPAQNYLRRFKTTHRAIFDQAWQTAETQGAFDSLFFNSTASYSKAAGATCSSNIADNGSRPL